MASAPEKTCLAFCVISALRASQWACSSLKQLQPASLQIALAWTSKFLLEGILRTGEVSENQIWILKACSKCWRWWQWLWGMWKETQDATQLWSKPLIVRKGNFLIKCMMRQFHSMFYVLWHVNSHRIVNSVYVLCCSTICKLQSSGHSWVRASGALGKEELQAMNYT